jgi:hypothetical protein
MTAPDPVEIALAVAEHLDALGIAHTIGGSLASSFAGEPRSTVDIDIVAGLEEFHVEALVSRLSGDFYVDAEALRRAIRTRGTANLIHQASQLKVDLFVAGGTPLERGRSRGESRSTWGRTGAFTSIRPKTSFYRSSGGTDLAERCRIGSGVTSWLSSEFRGRHWTARISKKAPAFWASRRCSAARSMEGPDGASRPPARPLYSRRPCPRFRASSERLLVDEAMLVSTTAALGGTLLDPITTTIVSGQRCMTTWVVGKAG